MSVVRVSETTLSKQYGKLILTIGKTFFMPGNTFYMQSYKMVSYAMENVIISCHNISD